MPPHTSTLIRSAYYWPDTEALELCLVNGGRYLYLGVPALLAEEFAASASKGRFFNARIRDHYRCTELVSEPEDWSEEWA